MLNAVVFFIVVALLAAILLWALGQFPTLDAGIVKLIRIVVLVVLSVLLLNLLLLLLVGRSLSVILHGG